MNYFDDQQPVMAPQMYTPQTMAGRMLQSPGLAAFNQGAANIAALKAGGVPNMSPVDAYQGQANNLSAQQRMNQELQVMRAQSLRRNQMARMEMERLSNPAYEFERLREAGHLPEDMTYQEYVSSALNNRTASSRAFAPQMGTIDGKRVMVTPVYNPATGAMSYQQTALPEGFNPDTTVQKVDAGDGTVLIDKQGRQVGFVGENLGPTQTPEYIAEAAQAGETGRTQAQKVSSAPARLSQIDTMLELTDNLLGNSSLDDIYGAVDQFTPTVRQESIDTKSDVRNLIARMVLDEREKLKGQGTISDFESKMLGDAATNLQNFGISGEKARDELSRIRDLLVGARERTTQLAPPSTGDGWSIERVD